MLDRIYNVVLNNPNKIAYSVDDKSITYKELWERSLDYSKYLVKQGTSPVIIYGGKEVEVIISILACIHAKRAYVPIGIFTPVYRVNKIIACTGSTLMLTNENVTFDNIEISSIYGLHKYEGLKDNEIDNDIIYMIFTSGSTGEPKGVPISESNLNNFVEWISSIEPLNEYMDIKVLNQANFSFDLSVTDLYYSLCNGHTLVAFNGNIQDDYEKVFEVFKGIDVAVMTPTFMRLCLLNNDFNSINYPDFKCVYFCGEQLDIKLCSKLFKKFPNIKIINAYGPTEATSAISSIVITEDMLEEKILPVGEVGKFATDVEIIDNEIVLKGKSVFNGYLSSIVGGYYNDNGINCYRTGDIGYIQDNKLYCKGRKDTQVKYKGYRIELNEIEYNINQLDGVKDCAVVAKFDHDIVKTIKAFVTLNGSIDEKNIHDELINRVPYYMVPKSIVVMDELPVNQNMKIDRKALINI